METKLKSILSRIHWSLALKAAVFGAAWFIFPFWAFALIGLYFYFFPFFNSAKFLLPFLILVFLAGTQPENVWFSIFLAVLFYLILGIKNLMIIKRSEASEVLIMLVLFSVFVRFFSAVDNWSGYLAFFGFLLVGILSFLLLSGLMTVGSEARGKIRNKPKIYVAILAFILWQVSLAVLFLPLNFLYQSALMFVFAATIVGLFMDHLRGELTRYRILANFSIFFTFTVIILGSAQWGL